MSSPAGPQYFQADFLAQWMPSSTRAGVILNPCPDLAGSLRHTNVGSLSRHPDDSFASDFAPLPASADSSCLGVDGFARSVGAERAGTDSSVNGLYSVPPRNSDGELDSLGDMASQSQDLSVMMKLEQLRKWQQHMQEQLKAHQLEELLRLQEEQQRLLGMMNGSQDSTGGMCDSREDEQDQSVDGNLFHEHEDTLTPSNGAALTDDDSREDKVLYDRPIEGQKKTFEELLEEQLRLEEQRLKSAQQQQSQDGAEAVQAPPKRAFLKRGEGLSRFTKASLPKTELKKDPKAEVQARVISRSNSEPAAIQRGSTNGSQRLPVQRKTATLNKENRQRGVSSPPQDIRTENKAAQTKVLGSHQRQNTGGSESRQLGQTKEQSSKKVGVSVHVAQHTQHPGHNTQPNPVTKQVGMVRGPGKTGNDAAREKCCVSIVGSEGGRTGSDTGTGDGVPRDSFELSFQEKLQRWECDHQLESMELGEFELLEQAAEELSFSSNSSFVIKVLQMDQLQAARGLHPRRLSSTPIKSPPRGARQRCSSVGSIGSIGAVTRKSSLMNSEARVVRDDRLENKVSIEDNRQLDSGRDDEQSEVSSCSGSEFEDQEVAVKPPLFPSTLCFPEQSNPPYDKRSYQDEDSRRGSASDVTQADDKESDSILSQADESTLMEDKDSQRGGVVFDDNDTWNDLEDTAVGTANDVIGVYPVSKATVKVTSPLERTLSRKVALSKVVDTVVGAANEEPGPPPPPAASQLMTRLFPSLKPRAQNAPLPPPPLPATSVAPECKKPEMETGQHVQSRLLRERLVELEIEIERFKKENARLAKLRQENERNQENLRKERLEFEQMKAEEVAKFEEYKKEENRKLQKERKLFEKHASAARAIPDKKEREEIQSLKQQLSSLQEELRGRESRWAATHSRLRQQIDSLSQENSSLQDEIRMLEKLRLSAWKKNAACPTMDKETNESLKVSENNFSSGTKGVKFASPLDSRGSSSPPHSAAAAATRRGSREGSQGATAGIKSSLRRPSGSASSLSVSSSSSLPGRRTEEMSTPASKSLDKPPNQSLSCSPEGDSLLKESECEAEEPETAQEVITHPDGKTEKVLAGGDRIITFANGTRKEVSADGLTVKVTFFNGDTKQITADQRVIYYYAEAQTSHITYPDGMEVLHFPNNQTEKHFPDGRKEITFPDQTVKSLFPGGREESVLTDGTIIQVNPDGTKQIHFNTGQREIHTADYKRREYPDGTVKTVYADGRQETRYPTGRLRIKDKDGNVIADNRA